MTSRSKFVCAIAAAGMVLTPIAAQAGTRAESSPVAVDVSRGSEGVVEGSELQFSIIWLLLLLAAVAGIVAAAGGGGGGDGRTRG